MEQGVSEDLIEAGRSYESIFVPALFEAWTTHLIDGANVQEGSHVLDIACGTGVLARSVLARTGKPGRVVGADPAPGMLAAAKEIEPGIDWILCGAEALDFDDEAFDSVVSQFGMMFFEDRQKSTDEMFRVLKPGGSLAIAVWGPLEKNPANAEIVSLLREQVGAAAADALRLPYCLGNPDDVTALLEESGFVAISVESATKTATYPNSRMMVEADIRGWLPLFDIFLAEDKVNQVLAESDRRLGKYTEPSGEAVIPKSAHIIKARKI